MADKTTLVTFNQDVYPYCFGDVVALTDEQLKAVDAQAKQRSLTSAYTKGAHEADSAKIATPTGDSDAEIARQRVETPTAPTLPDSKEAEKSAEAAPASDAGPSADARGTKPSKGKAATK